MAAQEKEGPTKARAKAEPTKERVKVVAAGTIRARVQVRNFYYAANSPGWPSSRLTRGVHFSPRLSTGGNYESNGKGTLVLLGSSWR